MRKLITQIKFIFDIANFYKSSERYKQAIKYYFNINTLENDSEIKAELLYRRGASFERLKDFEMQTKISRILSIKTDDAYVLNYLVILGLKEIIKLKRLSRCLRKLKQENNDPYIMNSIDGLII